MVHTLPDYTTKYKLTTIFGQIDTGELAARLGSIVTFDRRGYIVWMDDFEDTDVHWFVAGSGTGYAMARSADRARNGAYSMKVTCGSDASLQGCMRRYLMLPVSSNMGFELSFSMDSYIKNFVITIRWFDGTYNNYSYVKIDIENGKIQVRTSAGVYVDIVTGITFVANAGIFYTMKVVYNFVTRQYIRLIFGNTSYDLSSYYIDRTTNTTYPRLDLFIDAYGTSGQNAELFVDDVIVTQNEP